MAAQSFFFYLLFIGVSFVFFFFHLLMFMVKHYSHFFMIVVRMQTKNYDRRQKREREREKKHRNKLHCIYKTLWVCVIKRLNSLRISCEKRSDDMFIFIGLLLFATTWFVVFLHFLLCSHLVSLLAYSFGVVKVILILVFHTS